MAKARLVAVHLIRQNLATRETLGHGPLVEGLALGLLQNYGGVSEAARKKGKESEKSKARSIDRPCVSGY